MPPPGKKPFRFQMWMLSAIIIPVGIGFAVRDVMKKDSLELGEECSSSDHCKSHTCLTGEIGACTKTCNALSTCPSGFVCQNVSVTLQNQAGFHDLGAQGYCLKGTAKASTSAPAASSAPPAASTSPPVVSTPPPPAEPPPAKPAAPAKPQAKPKSKKP